MGWMTTKQSAIGAELHGQSIRINASVMTSSVLPAVCTKLWSSNTELRNVSLGKAISTPKHSQFQCLTVSQSYQE